MTSMSIISWMQNAVRAIIGVAVSQPSIKSLNPVYVKNELVNNALKMSS